MGSGASTCDAAPVGESAANLPFAEWDVERLAEYLDAEAKECATDGEAKKESAAVVAFVRANSIDGAAALEMNESRITEFVGKKFSDVNPVTRRLLELRRTFVADRDVEGKSAAEDDDATPHFQSTRVVRSEGSIFLMGVNRGMASAVNASELQEEACGVEYEEGFEVRSGGKTFGVVGKRLGMGAMGTVYAFDYAGRRNSHTTAIEEPGGDESHRCALKTARSNASPSEVKKLDNALATEVSICFACGRSPQIASVVDTLIPQAGVETNAKGLMLVCDLVDGGDLEEAMHSGAKLRNGALKHDYQGMLYSDAGATTWPLSSILLQIFKGFAHIHERGIIHQVIPRNEPGGQ